MPVLQRATLILPGVQVALLIRRERAIGATHSKTVIPHCVSFDDDQQQFCDAHVVERRYCTLRLNSLVHVIDSFVRIRRKQRELIAPLLKVPRSQLQLEDSATRGSKQDGEKLPHRLRGRSFNVEVSRYGGVGDCFQEPNHLGLFAVSCIADLAYGYYALNNRRVRVVSSFSTSSAGIERSSTKGGRSCASVTFFNCASWSTHSHNASASFADRQKTGGVCDE